MRQADVKVFGGKIYHYTENLTNKKRVKEELATFRLGGYLARAVPRRMFGRVASYDIYVRWTKRVAK